MYVYTNLYSDMDDLCVCVCVFVQMVEELHQSSHLTKLGSAFGTRSMGVEKDSQPQGSLWAASTMCTASSVCMMLWEAVGNHGNHWA